MEGTCLDYTEMYLKAPASATDLESGTSSLNLPLTFPAVITPAPSSALGVCRTSELFTCGPPPIRELNFLLLAPLLGWS